MPFKIQIEPDVQKVIEGDRLRIDQVLRNLLSNALKFTAQGSIDLHIRNHSEKPGFIIFSVKDTGVGIAKDKQKSFLKHSSRKMDLQKEIWRNRFRIVNKPRNCKTSWG